MSCLVGSAALNLLFLQQLGSLPLLPLIGQLCGVTESGGFGPAERTPFPLSLALPTPGSPRGWDVDLLLVKVRLVAPTALAFQLPVFGSPSAGP